MITELEKMLDEIKPGEPVKAEHVETVIRALMPILKMEAGTGIKITKSDAKFIIELSS